MLDQSRSFASYAAGVFRVTRKCQYDLVFVTSSRLMTAVMGAVVSRRIGAPLYVDIRDIFTDTMADIFARKPYRIVLPILRRAESWMLRRANRVNLVSPGFLQHFQEARPDLAYRTFSNGIDDEFINHDFEGGSSERDARSVILYAGNLGEGQGLERVVPEAATLLERSHEFWIVGDGGRREALRERLESEGVRNVRLMDPVPRAELIELYRRADYLFLHLNAYSAFYKVLPSKIFEYGATGKPILAGVAGYPREFIEANLDNAVTFEPCDATVERYRRSEIVERQVSDILELVDSTSKSQAGVSRL